MFTWTSRAVIEKRKSPYNSCPLFTKSELDSLQVYIIKFYTFGVLNDKHYPISGRVRKDSRRFKGQGDCDTKILDPCVFLLGSLDDFFVRTISTKSRSFDVKLFVSFSTSRAKLFSRNVRCRLKVLTSMKYTYSESSNATKVHLASKIDTDETRNYKGRWGLFWTGV